MDFFCNFVPSLGTYSAAPRQLKQASLHSACTSIVRLKILPMNNKRSIKITSGQSAVEPRNVRHHAIFVRTGGGIFCKLRTLLFRACCLFRRRNDYYHYDRIAMRIADRMGMTCEYKTARRHHLTPIEALEDWDLMMPEDYELFYDEFK